MRSTVDVKLLLLMVTGKMNSSKPRIGYVRKTVQSELMIICFVLSISIAQSTLIVGVAFLDVEMNVYLRCMLDLPSLSVMLTSCVELPTSVVLRLLNT